MISHFLIESTNREEVNFFSRLPVEITLLIFSFLSLDELRQVKMVSKNLYQFFPRAKEELKRREITNKAQDIVNQLTDFVNNKRLDGNKSRHCLECAYQVVKGIFDNSTDSIFFPSIETIAKTLIDTLKDNAHRSNRLLSEVLNATLHPWGLTYLHLFLCLGIGAKAAIIRLYLAGANFNPVFSDGTSFNSPWAGFFSFLRSQHKVSLGKYPSIRELSLNYDFLDFIIRVGANFNFSLEKNDSASYFFQWFLIHNSRVKAITSEQFSILQLLCLHGDILNTVEPQLYSFKNTMMTYQSTIETNSIIQINQAVVSILRLIRSPVLIKDRVHLSRGETMNPIQFLELFQNIKYCDSLLYQQSPVTVATELVNELADEASHDMDLLKQLINKPGCCDQRLIDVFKTINNQEALSILLAAGASDVSSLSRANSPYLLFKQRIETSINVESSTKKMRFSMASE